MKFLEMPIRKGEFVAKQQGTKEYPEAKQPPLYAKKFSGAAKRPQLQIRRERRRRDLGEVLRPLDANALCKLQVLLHVIKQWTNGLPCCERRWRKTMTGWTRFSPAWKKEQSDAKVDVADARRTPRT